METKRLAERITKGTATAMSLKVDCVHGIIAECPVPSRNGVMACVANSKLIAEAFNVTNQCGYTPKELLEQRNELVESLRFLLNANPNIGAWDYAASAEKARQVLKKYQP